MKIDILNRTKAINKMVLIFMYEFCKFILTKNNKNINEVDFFKKNNNFDDFIKKISNKEKFSFQEDFNWIITKKEIENVLKGQKWKTFNLFWKISLLIDKEIEDEFIIKVIDIENNYEDELWKKYIPSEYLKIKFKEDEIFIIDILLRDFSYYVIKPFFWKELDNKRKIVYDILNELHIYQNSLYIENVLKEFLDWKVEHLIKKYEDILKIKKQEIEKLPNISKYKNTLKELIYFENQENINLIEGFLIKKLYDKETKQYKNDFFIWNNWYKIELTDDISWWENMYWKTRYETTFKIVDIKNENNFFYARFLYKSNWEGRSQLVSEDFEIWNEAKYFEDKKYVEYTNDFTAKFI